MDADIFGMRATFPGNGEDGQKRRRNESKEVVQARKRSGGREEKIDEDSFAASRPEKESPSARDSCKERERKTNNERTVGGKRGMGIIENTEIQNGVLFTTSSFLPETKSRKMSCTTCLNSMKKTKRLRIWRANFKLEARQI